MHLIDEPEGRVQVVPGTDLTAHFKKGGDPERIRPQAASAWTTRAGTLCAGEASHKVSDGGHESIQGHSFTCRPLIRGTRRTP